MSIKLDDWKMETLRGEKAEKVRASAHQDDDALVWLVTQRVRTQDRVHEVRKALQKTESTDPSRHPVHWDLVEGAGLLSAGLRVPVAKETVLAALRGELTRAEAEQRSIEKRLGWAALIVEQGDDVIVAPYEQRFYVLPRERDDVGSDNS